MFENSDDDLKELITHSPTAYGMLLMLPRESWLSHYAGLRDYIRWVYERGEHSDKFAQFEIELAEGEKRLKERVESGEITEEQVEQKRAAFVWWRALEESQNAALFMAFRSVIERKIIEHLNNEPAKLSKTLDEVRNEVERELIAKLRQCLSAGEV